MIHYRHTTRPSTAGGSYFDTIDGASYKEAKPDSGPIICPLTLRFNVFVEGVDDPFRTRWRASEPHQKIWAVRRAKFLAAASRLTPFSLPILASAPDDFPTRVDRLGEVPLGWRRQEHRQTDIAVASGLNRNVTLLSESPATEYAVTVCDILNEIQRHLLEHPIDNGVTWSLWSAQEVYSSLSDRISRFNQLTGVVRKRSTIGFGVGQADGDMPDDFMQLRRAVWNSGTEKTVLSFEDAYLLDNSAPGWQTAAGVPISLIKEPLTKSRLRLYPKPALVGTAEILYIPSFTVSGCESFPLPSVFASYIKWGVLSDLLSKEGEANDPERAEYAEQRFEEGVELARALLGTHV
jgi:hypothetical protein